jgi:transcriptional regulator with XRE-family HTH domain
MERRPAEGYSARVHAAPDVGRQLREWRERRRRTQLDLALDAGISARHLSFVETGRSKPGRDMLVRALRELDVPYREQNELLLAAGHAPAFPERSLDDPALGPVRDALDLVLREHQPYPAVAFDRNWDLVAANDVMWAMARQLDIDDALLEPPMNILRLGLHPDGMAPYLANLAEWRSHFLGRLRRQVVTTGDARLAELLEEVAAYPGGGYTGGVGTGGGDAGDREVGDRTAAGHGRRVTNEILGPLRVSPPGDIPELSFLGMFATFDTPFEVTASELAVELLFPADEATAEVLHRTSGLQK